MKPFFVRTLLMAALLASLVNVAAAATKIMPLGDSITGSPGCWRAYLWDKLQTGGYTNLDFVGTLAPQGCPVAHDGDNEGHGGILATNMADQNQLPAWLAATKPDVVLVHLGTNDVWSSKSTATILAAFSTLVSQMRASNPNMKILFAQIIPMDSASSCSTCADGVIALNAALPAWANGLSTSASPVKVVDLWTGFSATADTYDGVHPTNAGHLKMAEKWYPAVVNLLGGSVSSSSVSSVNSSAAISSSSSLKTSSSSSSSSAVSGAQCNWYGQLYPLCVTTSSGWGYENNKSCIARSTCAAQPAPYGVVGGNSSAATSSIATSSVVTSTSASSKSSSSAPAISTSSSVVTSSSIASSAQTSSATSSTNPIGISCSYVITNAWGSGFTGAIRITNRGSPTLSSWTAKWQYTGTNRLTSSWNANVTGTNPYVATNLSWNGSIATGQTVEFGFQGNTNGGVVETPVVTCQ